jgi:hypothetical protein
MSRLLEALALVCLLAGIVTAAGGIALSAHDELARTTAALSLVGCR